jgi:hypothetical protein
MAATTEPIIVTISHRLGRDEAKRRIDTGLGAIRGEIAPYIKSVDYHWEDHRLEFRVAALMQAITGRIDVHDDFVRVEFGLPRLLHLVAKRLIGHIERQGAALLEPPGKPR